MAQHARRTVLLVEDDDSMREAIARLLDVSGFDCTAYPSAEALLAGGAEKDAVCVVSDLKLPAMSGLQLLTELQVQAEWPPLILITGHDAPGLQAQAALLGAAAYLVKPFLGTALLAAIQAVIKRSRPS
jgi:FixJ family two-component response regulator